MDEDDERRVQEVLEPEENELFILVPEFLDFLTALEKDFETNPFKAIRSYISSHTLEQ